MDEQPEMETIAGRIIVLRGQRVMLDADLAALYGVKTERLNEQVRRNVARFPADFVFRLDAGEWRETWSQNATKVQRQRQVGRTSRNLRVHCTAQDVRIASLWLSPSMAA